MNNRFRAFPIFVVVLGVSLSTERLSLAEPGVPGDTNSAPVSAPEAPASTNPAPVAPAEPPPAPASTTTPAGTPTTPAVMPVDSGITYKVKKGDSLWSVAHKFHTTVDALRQLNNLTTNDLKLKQVLKIPASKSKKPKTPATPAGPNASITPKKKSEKTYAMAQPVQDFDVPASTFASCPVPVSSNADDGNSTAAFTPATDTTSAPVAKLVSPQELTEDSTPAEQPEPIPAKVKHSTPAPVPLPVATSTPDEDTTPASETTLTYTTSSSKQFNRYPGTQTASTSVPSTSELAGRFLQQARALGSLGISYDESWRPPQESKSWVMDCSNTSRYLYKVTTGILLPRTASDQYFYLHQQNKAWDVPDASNGYADCNYLRRNLKIGDLLFWENTYRPERQPPITHVMIFLGTNEKGQWIMAGSQSSSGGEHSRRHGGPDIYVFDPTRPSGGYTTWMGFVHHKGRFCAYGRPLEADAAKLALVAND